MTWELRGLGLLNIFKLNTLIAYVSLSIYFVCLIKVSYIEEHQNEILFAPEVALSTSKNKLPRLEHLEPLIEEIESPENTPSYEFREV